jgi:Icc-related predicted phosphoesterase
MVKIVAIGDPHGNLGKIKKIPLKNSDFILVTGDIGKADFARKKTF